MSDKQTENMSPPTPPLSKITEKTNNVAILYPNLCDNFDNAAASPMLPKSDDKVVILNPNSVGKILIREDTVLGCAGCGRAQFNCTGVEKQWSALCWGKQSESKYYCLLVLLSTTFALSLIGTVFFCFTNTINDAIIDNMVIRNNSIAYSMWRRPSVQPLMKVHLFNYTNWREFRNGEADKLKVEDVGPYVYSQQIERVDVSFEGDQVTYKERNTFRYRPDKSTGSPVDRVNVPNLPLIGVLSRAKDLNLNFVTMMTLNGGLSLANHKEAFVDLPAHRFMWGYDDSIINVAKPFLSFSGAMKFDQFGLLVMKNGTVDDVLTVNTGELNKARMNVLEKLDGKDSLDYWQSECNSIEASDGTIFPPSSLDRKSPLYVFFANLCRRLAFKYEKDVTTEDGVPLLRYRLPSNVFDDPKHNKANECFCDYDAGTCPPRGVINVTACTMGAPALVSFPHFLRADPKLLEQIEGLKPNPEEHDSYLDIHPTLGIALNGRSNLQINVQIRTHTHSPIVSFLEGLILPVAWIDMTVEELPESLRSLVYHGTYSTAAAQLGLTVACILTLIISSICLITMVARRRKQRPCATIKLSPTKSFPGNDHEVRGHAVVYSPSTCKEAS